MMLNYILLVDKILTYVGLILGCIDAASYICTNKIHLNHIFEHPDTWFRVADPSSVFPGGRAGCGVLGEEQGVEYCIKVIAPGD